MSEWAELRKLSDISDIIISNVDKKTKPTEVPVRLCNYTDVYKNQYIRSSMNFMSATATNHEINKCTLFKGDVVITKDSETHDDIGVAAYVSDHIENLVCGYHLVILRPNPDKLNGAFLFYVLNTDESKCQFHARANGITRFGLRKVDIGTVEIPVPPLSEQKAIARILGSLDDKIELNRRMNETLEAMARAIFKDWFVDFGPTRAKMEGRTPYLPEPIWSLFPEAIDPQSGLPIGWEEKSLDQIADFLNGLALQKYPPLEGEESLPVIKIAELRSGITVKSGRASSQIPRKYIVQDGDFLFSWSGSLVAKFWTGGKGALNQHLFKVTSANYPKWFYTQWIYEHLESFQHIAASKATTMGHIQRGHLTAAKVICPQSNSMITMSDLVAPLLDKTIKNDLESRTLAELRDRLLPKLMSGEIRVKDAERLVEEVL